MEMVFELRTLSNGKQVQLYACQLCGALHCGRMIERGGKAVWPERDTGFRFTTKSLQ